MALKKCFTSSRSLRTSADLYASSVFSKQIIAFPTVSAKPTPSMTNVASAAAGCWAAAFKQSPLASVAIVKQHATDWKNLFDVIFETPF
jgi:hypothetical protein